jgi:hypothetical protein
VYDIMYILQFPRQELRPDDDLKIKGRNM